jgi:hypothetical protein
VELSQRTYTLSGVVPKKTVLKKFSVVCPVRSSATTKIHFVLRTNAGE